MLERLRHQARYRRALRTQAAPSSGAPAYHSRFGGLWTDRRDAGDEVDRRLESGLITADDAEHLRHWIAHGYLILKGGVEPDVCDRLRANLDAAFTAGDPRLLMTSPAVEGYQPLQEEADTGRVRVVDVYAFYESARLVLFSEPIVNFLRTVFDDAPLLFQSLTFEKGSQQPLHQDTAFVVTSSPLEFAAAWIALEDIRPGSGELKYLDGSHRLPEYLFSGKYKHWNRKRDGDEQQADWRSHLLKHTEEIGLKEKTFVANKGDLLIWAADLAHGGSPVTDASLTRKSLVGHYCPNRVEPFYFRVEPGRRGKQRFDGGFYASGYYALGT